MGGLVAAEVKKIVFSKKVMGIWLASLLLSYVSIRAFGVEDMYADVFSKAYGLMPLMGLIIFASTCDSYVRENVSNVSSIINSSKNGREKIVAAKGIAAGITCSALCVSIFGTMFFTAASKVGFEGMDLPVRSLWYFGNSGSAITVMQMVLITGASIAAGAFFFAQLGLLFSSAGKGAALPFIGGGLVMGLPYLMEGFLRCAGKAQYRAFTPTWGMMGCQFTRHGISMKWEIANVIAMMAAVALFQRLTVINFVKEK